MTTDPISEVWRSNLRDVIAAAIWRREQPTNFWQPFTTNPTLWADLRQTDREEFEQDADAVLEALANKGYTITGPGAVNTGPTP